MKKWIKRLRLFRPDSPGVESVLGDLETAVMEASWSCRDFGIKELHEQLARDREIAYTTVQTTIERLFQKGLLKRTGHGRTFRYSPAVSRDELFSGIARRVLDALFGNFGEPTMASLIDVLQERDPEDLERLMTAIEARRSAESQQG